MKAYRELEVNEMRTENVIALKKKIENAIAERRNFTYRMESHGFVEVRFDRYDMAQVYVYGGFANVQFVTPVDAMQVEFDDNDDFLFLACERRSYVAIYEKGVFE